MGCEQTRDAPPPTPLMRVLYALAHELRWLEVRMPTGSLLVCSEEFQIFSSCTKIWSEVRGVPSLWYTSNSKNCPGKVDGEKGAGEDLRLTAVTSHPGCLLVPAAQRSQPVLSRAQLRG